MKHLFYRLILTAWSIVVANSSQGQIENRLPEFQDWLELLQVRTTEDTTIDALRQQIDQSLNREDTLSAINSLRELGSLYTNRLHFGDSYDAYWQLILLAESSKDSVSLAKGYVGLSILYSLYERRDEALRYLELSLEVRKKLISHGKLEEDALGGSYFPMAIHYRFDKNLKQAKAYLDSTANLWGPTLVLDSELGFQLIAQQHYDEAEQLLKNIQDSMAIKIPKYMMVFLSYLGDLCLQTSRYSEAIEYYELSILSGYEHLHNLNYLPDIYLKLATAYENIGNYKLANHYLTTGNKINVWLYSSRSPNNRYLLEIKDLARIENEKKQKLLAEQKIARLEQERQIWWLRAIIFLTLGLLLTLLVVVWIKRIRRIHKQEQIEMKRKQQLEEQKNKAILSIKNRELTNSTLQIIAKDELLSELKEDLRKLQKTSGSKEVQPLINNIQVNMDMSWLEFENRFTSVNSDFFDKLKARYPHLKPYDHKICALIKLNFSGKEMAKLLGISPESANTSRYRLRKRLGLDKDDNLVEFIDSI